MTTGRYPTQDSPFQATLPETYQRFAELREDFLMDHGYNTARAYWNDLDEIFQWCVRREKDMLRLSDAEVQQYCALLRRRKYSENTIRRRVSTWRRFQAHIETTCDPPA